MPAKKTTEDAPKRHEVNPEPSLAGVGPDDPTYQKLVVVSERPDTPEERRDAVLADQAADLAGKPRPPVKTN